MGQSSLVRVAIPLVLVRFGALEQPIFSAAYFAGQCGLVVNGGFDGDSAAFKFTFKSVGAEAFSLTFHSQVSALPRPPLHSGTPNTMRDNAILIICV